MKTSCIVALVVSLMFSSACKRRSSPESTGAVSPETKTKAKAEKSAKDTDAVKIMMAEIDARPAPESPKARRTEWLRAISVEAYEKVGERNPAWDVRARAALVAFAELNAADPKDGELLAACRT